LHDQLAVIDQALKIDEWNVTTLQEMHPMTLPLLPRYHTNTAALEKPMDKIKFTGKIISVKARIRLIRSFDQVPTHQYQGYTLILDGEVDGMRRDRMKVAIGHKAHEQHQFRIGDSIRGHAIPVPDSETEWADLYRVSTLQLIERARPGDWPPGPDGGIAPPLEQYRAQGHFRLKRETCETECLQCPFGLTQKRDGLTGSTWIQTHDNRSGLSQPMRRLGDGDPRLFDELENLEGLEGV
jgi:hypothetical protein